MGPTLNGCHLDIRKVLVLGDNRLATSILSGLLPGNDDREGIELYQAVRLQSSATKTTDLTIHKTDFSSESLRSLFTETKPDVIFSTFSAGSLETQTSIIDTAISSGIRRFVPAEFGQDSQNPSLQQSLPPLQGRAKVIQYLKELSNEDKIQWVAVATGTQLDQALISGNIGFDMKWQSATIHGKGDEDFAASSTSWNGKVARAVLEQWEQVKNQYIYASGMITNANECLVALQDASGHEWTRGNNDVEDMVREADQRINRGFPDAGTFLLEKSVLCDETLKAVAPFQANDAKAVLGLEAEDLAVLVKRAVHDFRHHGRGDCGCG